LTVLPSFSISKELLMTDIFDRELPEIEAEDRGERFHIDSDSAANWLLRRLANIEAEKARVTAQAAQICKDLDADAQRLRHLYEGELIDFARQRLAETGRGKRTLHLLQGSVHLRFVPASIRVFDPFRALEYAQRSAPELVKTAVTIDAGGYRDQAAKHFKATGQLLPGIESTPAHETHRVSF
jgi:phage host-nuclease inhibitor protein Gam